jgi:signal transduction histidine kinase
MSGTSAGSKEQRRPSADGAHDRAAVRSDAGTARVRALLDAVPTPLALFDERDRLIHANALFDAFPEIADVVAARLSLGCGVGDQPERMVVGHGGQHRLVEVTVARLTADGRPLGRLLCVRDIGDGDPPNDRLSALGRLAAGLVHDVNNALNPILAATHLLKLRAGDPAAVREYADRIAAAVESGAATAARVGRFIRQQPPAYGFEDIVDLSLLADEAIATIQPGGTGLPPRAGGAGVVVDLRLAPAVRVRGTPSDLREGVLALLHNALDAMPGEGTLTVETRLDGSAAVLEVRDTGHGMSRETCVRAFEPFFTTRGNRRLGLGLAEVYGIARRHGGVAALDSVPGSGTVAWLRLPLARAELRPENREGLRDRRRRVLLVEDDGDNRELLCAMLRAEGHDVMSARGIAEATAMLERTDQAHEPFDVLLTDIGLPDGSGWELVDTARQRWPWLRVGVVSGWEAERTDGAGAHFILRKPIRGDDLAALVAER